MYVCKLEHKDPTKNSLLKKCIVVEEGPVKSKEGETETSFLLTAIIAFGKIFVFNSATFQQKIIITKSANISRLLLFKIYSNKFIRINANAIVHKRIFTYVYMYVDKCVFTFRRTIREWICLLSSLFIVYEK